LTDARRVASAAARNRDPILEVLRTVLPPSGLVLEIASGTGEHAIHFAAALPALRFVPSDPDRGARASIAAWRDHAAVQNLAAPIDLDVLAPAWWARAPHTDAILCINLIHIAPWEATLGLLAGAAILLEPGAPLLLYGPFRRGGRHTAPSNAAFDASLRARDERFGVRDLEAVERVAGDQGLSTDRVVEMPANNLCVALRRLPDAEPGVDQTARSGVGRPKSQP
jgi:hypothetical protein